MLKNILNILLIIPTNLVGQTASFFADTTLIYEETKNRNDVFEKIMEAEWRINGQILKYGSKPILIQTDEIPDTIFFRQRKSSKWDTLICNINQPKHYTFLYNSCCGAFNIADETGKFIEGSAIFEIKGRKNRKHYLGTLGETGVIVDQRTDTLVPGCRSAMSPNVYKITFAEIKICNDSVICNEETCLYEVGKKELNYEFAYRTISLKIEFLFIPLSNIPIQIIYNPKTGNFRIE